MSSVLVASQVTYVVQESGRQRTILDQVDMHVDNGEVVVLLGRSGSGKSSLLHLACGVERPTSGRIHIEGIDLATLGEPGTTLLRRRRIGMVFQQANLIPTLTVADNVGLRLGLDGKRDPEAVRQILTDVDLADRAQAWPERLSGGEQQRVAVAMALLHRPGLLLADEPTGALDSNTASVVAGLCVDLARKNGTAVLIATHDHELCRSADRVLRLVDGRLVAA